MIVIGVGNELRGDDAAGLLVARLARERGLAAYEEHGDASALITAWEGHDHVVLVDAMRSGAPPGTVAQLTPEEVEARATQLRSTSTHLVDVAEAIGLARVLGRLPARLTLMAIEGTDFTTGAALTPQVQSALPALVDMIVAEAERHT